MRPTGHALDHLSLSSRSIVGILRFRGKHTRNIPPGLPKRVTSQWTQFSVYTGQTTTRRDEHAIYFVVRRYRNVSMKYVLAVFSTQQLVVNDRMESERKDIEQRIVMENENGSERWNVMGNRLPKSEIVYFCQMIVSMSSSSSPSSTCHFRTERTIYG